MRTLLVVLTTLFAATSSQAAIGLPRDASGWSILTPSEETQIVYLAASPTGNDSSCVAYSPNNPLVGADPFNPTGDVLECATFAKAHELVQWSGPDWILARRGDTFSGGVVIKMSGKSATEPFVFASYGSSGAMPIFKPNDSTNGLDIGYRNNIVVSGIEFYSSSRDPNSGDYTTADNAVFGFYLHGTPTEGVTMNDILIEGCKFRFFYANGVAGYNNSSNIVLRRNVIIDNYASSGIPQGLLFSGTLGGAIVEENVLDHNGWLVQNDGDGTTESGEATLFSQGFYGGGNVDIIIRRNINSRPSSIAWKFAGYTGDPVQQVTDISDNLVIDAEVGVSIWGEDSDSVIHYTNLSIANNILTNLGRSNQTNREFGWGIDLANIETGAVTGNIIMNQVDSSTYGHGMHFRGKLGYINISGNVFNNLYNTHILQPDDDINHVPNTGQIIFSNNKINITSNSERIVYDYYGLLDGWSFAGNYYYTSGADGSRFLASNVDKTDAQWVTLTGDNSTFSQPTFPDSTRSVETYMQSLGETATIDAFIAKARTQDRYNWDTSFTADAVNDYIRAGFGMGARRLFRNVRLHTAVEP